MTALPATRRLQDWAQVPLILLSLLVAYGMPFEGVFAAYVVLGPLHYLTQISWLHDRRYFFAEGVWRPVFVGLACLLALWLVVPLGPLARPDRYGIAFIVAALLLMPLFLNTALKRHWQLGLLAALPLAVWALLKINALVLLCAVLVPSFIHVGVFTFIFLLAGARKTGSAAAIISAGLWAAAALLLVLVPPAAFLHFTEWFTDHRAYFDAPAQALGAVADAPLDAGWSRAYGLLTFAFTYHYLNWFSKTELLQWHKMPRRRGLGILLLYLAALGIYALDFRIGFRVLLGLSALHIFLEFPLDWIALRSVFARARD